MLATTAERLSTKSIALMKPTISTKPDAPDPVVLGGRVVVIAYEVLLGVRAIQQLTQWVSPAVLTELHRRQQLVARLSAPTIHLASHSVRLVRVLACQVNPSVVEVTAIIHINGRTHAAAARVEYYRGRRRVGVLVLG